MEWNYTNGRYIAPTHLGTYIVEPDGGGWKVRLRTDWELFHLGWESDSRLGMTVAQRHYREANE